MRVLFSSADGPKPKNVTPRRPPPSRPEAASSSGRAQEQPQLRPCRDSWNRLPAATSSRKPSSAGPPSAWTASNRAAWRDDHDARAVRPVEDSDRRPGRSGVAQRPTTRHRAGWPGDRGAATSEAVWPPPPPRRACGRSSCPGPRLERNPRSGAARRGGGPFPGRRCSGPATHCRTRPCTATTLGPRKQRTRVTEDRIAGRTRSRMGHDEKARRHQVTAADGCRVTKGGRRLADTSLHARDPIRGGRSTGSVQKPSTRRARQLSDSARPRATARVFADTRRRPATRDGTEKGRRRLLRACPSWLAAVALGSIRGPPCRQARAVQRDCGLRALSAADGRG